MAYILYNPNPARELVGDCTVRAISIVTGKDWNTVYVDLCIEGFMEKDMPSSNEVWQEYLYRNNFKRYIVPDTCPVCYTVKRFCKDHPRGIYLLATGSHVIGVINGNYFDTWNSGNEVIIYYFQKEE